MPAPNPPLGPSSNPPLGLSHDVSRPRFEEDDWVIVSYNSAWYPGKVESISVDFATVNCLEFVKKSVVNKVSTWKWPSIKPDVEKYSLERLKKVALYRHVASRTREFFEFTSELL